MRAFHDTRNVAYRAPFGAVTPGKSVTLSIDVWDASDLSVALRTWVDGEGERVYGMSPVPAENGVAEEKTRYQTTIVPESACVIWYHFILSDNRAFEKRYGAKDGRTGGVGEIRDWEPPSFQLTVHAMAADAAETELSGICYEAPRQQFLQSEKLIAQLDYLEGLDASVLRINPPLQDEATVGQLRSLAQSRHITLENGNVHDEPSYDQLCEALASGNSAQLENRAFGDTLVRFLRNEATAYDLVESIEQVRENYPKATFGSMLNPLGAQGGTRLLTRLGGAPDASSMSLDQRMSYKLDDGQRGLAKGRLWCACLIQMLIPGMPVMCCGDEAGIEGYPEQPATQAFPWSDADPDCQAIVCNVIDLRRISPLFTAGSFSCFAVDDNVFGFWRQNETGEAMCVLVNASSQRAYDIPVPMVSEAVSEIIDGYDVRIAPEAEVDNRQIALPKADSYAIAHLKQLGAAILYFHPAQLLEKDMQPGVGVLAHITSLPADSAQDGDRSAQRTGTLGTPSRTFVDWLARAGMQYWQVLPINPTDSFGSPYAGISAFAGNTLLLEDAAPSHGKSLAYLETDAGYLAFRERESDWLEPYASFMAIREKLGSGMSWQSWPERYRRYDSAMLDDDPDLAACAESWRQSQYLFEVEWKNLKSYANDRGVQLIGDMPLYVNRNSADVWAHPELFQLDTEGLPSVVAGCPPDPFAIDGQIWGNPVYDWEALEADGYAWWLRRLERSFELYDIVRLDHFIGFARYFTIPSGEKAIAGAYHHGPGLEFFRKAHDAFGPLPIIAEDLGLITPAVRALSAMCGFPGMDIVQFVDGNDPLSGYRPRPNKIAYTGTHDNQTLVGYALERYPDMPSDETSRHIMEEVATCSSDVCVFPLQDLIGLDNDARMNEPGTTEGNWSWQATREEVGKASETARQLARLHVDSR